MKPKVLKPVLAIGTTFLIVAFVLVSCGPTIGYWRFAFGTAGYYARFAKACDTLIAQPGLPRDIRGDALQSLPAELRHINPYCVVVDTNVVMVRDAAGLLSHKIIWAPASTDEFLWELKVYSGDSRQSHTVFSKRKHVE